MSDHLKATGSPAAEIVTPAPVYDVSKENHALHAHIRRLEMALERIAYSAHADTAPVLRGYAQEALGIAPTIAQPGE